jgi:hypothetical protein
MRTRARPAFNLKHWLRASDGRHGLVVAADPDRLPLAQGFFELRLLADFQESPPMVPELRFA